MLQFVIVSLCKLIIVFQGSHPYVVVSLAVSVVCFPTFILVEYHAPKPVMPLRLIFGIPRANLIFSNFIGALLYSAVLFNV